MDYYMQNSWVYHIIAIMWCLKLSINLCDTSKQPIILLFWICSFQRSSWAIPPSRTDADAPYCDTAPPWWCSMRLVVEFLLCFCCVHDAVSIHFDIQFMEPLKLDLETHACTPESMFGNLVGLAGSEGSSLGCCWCVQESRNGLDACCCVNCNVETTIFSFFLWLCLTLYRFFLALLFAM